MSSSSFRPANDILVPSMKSRGLVRTASRASSSHTRPSAAAACSSGASAQALRLTAQDLYELGVIDRIVSEPLGGAQRDPNAAIAAAGRALVSELDALDGTDPATLVRNRRQKFIRMGEKGLG